MAGRPLQKAVRAVVALAAAWLLLVSQHAGADELADVGALLRAGKSTEAMAKIDAFLEKQPRDMQMRFMKGVVLTEQGKTTEAIAAFTKLTEEHPDLPEPYNNLAVLFAASGQYDKARAALDMAIRTNPSYATAYENLGDVHAKLASQAYDKALQLDSGNTNAKSKLTLLKTLAVNVTGKDSGKMQTANAARPGSRPYPTTPPIVIAKADAAPGAGARPVVIQEVKPDPKPEPKPVPKAPAPSEPKAETRAKPEAKPKPADSNAENEAVLAVVSDWAQAWSARDVKRYLGHYASDFDTPRNESRKAWADERTARIVGKGRISVKVNAPQVTLNGQTATVKFRQVYASDRLQADSRKTLVLTRQDGRWQIKQERTGA